MVYRRAPALNRRAPRRSPKKRFTIYCEGANTEPQYFRALKLQYRDALITIDTVAPAGVPYTIARRAVEFIKRLEKEKADSFEEGDEVWVVFDRDEHQRFNEAVNLCNQKGIGVARSDPCFELWLILHLIDFDKPDDGRAVRRRLGKLRSEYDPGGAKLVDCATLIHSVKDAEQRAANLLNNRVREGNPFGRPSTTVGDLTKAIRKAAADFAS